MNLRIAALTLAFSLFCAAALAADTYVFPSDGFRYTEAEGETVLTRTNLDAHAALLTQLGTSPEAVRASYAASGTAMEVLPEGGGQIAISVVPAGELTDAREIEALDAAGREALLARFAESGLYADCRFAAVDGWLRLTSSAMYGSMPVWQLRYATLHLGSLLTLTSTVVGREPEEADDAQLQAMIGRLKLLTAAAQPSPTTSPEATPTPAPAQTQTDENAPKLTITEPQETTLTGSRALIRGVTEPNAVVYVTGEGLNTNVRANKNGVFSAPVTLPEAGSFTFTLRVSIKDKGETERQVTLTRVLTEREELSAFRSAQASVTYQQLAGDAAAYAGKNFVFRGRVMSFTDYDGSPCAMVCVSNPQQGVWRDPIYCVLSVGDDAEVGTVYTFYLVGEGFTMPAPGEVTSSGNEEEAPVARVFRFTTNR